MVTGGRLKGAARIGMRVGQVVNKYKVRKHFDIAIGESALTFKVNDASVAAEAALDGLYVIRTSAAAAAMSDEQTVLNYKRLAEVERAFRTLKGIDLQVRPIRHRLETRVRAHIFLSMLAYYVQWHMIEAWAPLTFKDEADAGPARLRRSRGSGQAFAGSARQGAHAHARRRHAGNELHAPSGASRHHRAQHHAAQERPSRRGHLYPHHPTHAQAATGPRLNRRHHRVASAARPASTSTR